MNKKFIKILAFSLLMTFLSLELSAQDPVFSQFYNAPLHLNPALTGNTFGPKIAINYRNQWPSLPWAYVSYNASYDQFFKKYNSGFGISVLSDDAGDGIFKTNKISLDYAYAIKISRNNYLKIGLEPTLSQSRLNWSKLIFSDQIDGSTGVVTPGGSNLPGTEIEPDNTNRLFFDFAVGGVYYNPNFYVGASVKHLTAPDIQYINSGKSETIKGIPLRVSAHVGGQIYIPSLNIKKNKAYFAPQLLYTHQGPFNHLILGGNLDIGVLSLGTWFRHAIKNSDAIVASVGFEQEFFRLEYSYDITLTSLNQGGAHEIGIVLTFEDKNKPTPYNDCFEIFR